MLAKFLLYEVFKSPQKTYWGRYYHPRLTNKKLSFMEFKALWGQVGRSKRWSTRFGNIATGPQPSYSFPLTSSLYAHSNSLYLHHVLHCNHSNPERGTLELLCHAFLDLWPQTQWVLTPQEDRNTVNVVRKYRGQV